MTCRVPSGLNAWLKSPARSAAGGTLKKNCCGVLWYWPSHAPKKNSLFFTIGPPSVTPSMCELAFGFSVAKYGLALKLSLL